MSRPLQLAVTGLRRWRGRLGHRRHAGQRHQSPANLHPLARFWKASFSSHAQSRRTLDAKQIRKSARPNILIVQYFQNNQIADRYPGDTVRPIRRALHHCLFPLGRRVGFAYAAEDVLTANEALDTLHQLVATRWTEDGTHAIKILDRVAADRWLPIGAASGHAYLFGHLPIRHRRHARHPHGAPSDAHAIAGLQRASLPTHQSILTRGRGRRQPWLRSLDTSSDCRRQVTGHGRCWPATPSTGQASVGAPLRGALNAQ